MKQREIRLYNVLLPIWLLWVVPKVWIVILPGNLIIDCMVLLLALAALKHQGKRAVVKQLWWKFWVLGFVADAVGVAWLFLGWALSLPLGKVWEDTVVHITHNAFDNPGAFLWMLAGVALAGLCIYFLDRLAMRRCTLLSEREKQRIALTMAIVTAPWTFFIPIY